MLAMVLMTTAMTSMTLWIRVSAGGITAEASL